MSWALRPATDADRESLYALHRATMRPYVEEIWGWDEDVQLDLFTRRFDPACCSVVLTDGDLAGMLRIETRPDALFLANIQIRPELQNRGLGSAIIRWVVSRAIAEGRRVELRVLRNNPARRLYERLGFILDAETKHHYQMTYRGE